MLEYSLILHARLHTLGYIWYEDKRGDILIMILSYISIFLTIPMRVFLVLFLLFFFLIIVGCPGQLAGTTTIPHGPLSILQAQWAGKAPRGWQACT